MAHFVIGSDGRQRLVSKSDKPMCDDKEQARLNRERVWQGYCNQFYAEQAHILAQWQDGHKPPENLVLGSLPEVNLKAIRLDRD